MVRRYREESLHEMMSFDWLVDYATGKFFFYVLDYKVPDISQEFRLCRAYAAGGERRGTKPFGKYWLPNVAGGLSRHQEKLRVLLGDFHWHKFVKKGEAWESLSEGERYRLKEQRNGYILTDVLRHTEYTYDIKGKLLSKQTEKRPPLAISYDGNKIQDIRLSTEDIIHMEYERGKLARLTDALGREIKYRYQGEFLQEVVYPNGGIVRYTYTEEGWLSSCIDAENQCRLRVEYDEEGHVRTLFFADGSSISYAYDYQNRCMRERRSDGTTAEYHWNRQYLVTRICHAYGEETMEYDEAGHLVRYCDPMGGVLRRKYDTAGRLVFEAYPNGYERQLSYNAEGFLIRETDNCEGDIRMRYSPQGWLTQRMTFLGRKEWRIEETEWDRKGRKTAVWMEGHATRYAYEENAPLPAMLETPCGGRFSFRYDKAWRKMVIHSELGERSFGWNPMDCLVLERDAEGRETSYFYDFCGNPVIDSPASSYKEEREEVAPFVQCEYDRKGRLVLSQTQAQREASREGLSLCTFYQYAPNGCIEERMAYEEADGESRFRLRRWKYDAQGNPVEVRTWLEGQTLHSASGRVRTVKMSYDGMSRLVLAEDSHGARQEYRYNSLNCCILEKRLIAQGVERIIRYVYDKAGMLVSRNERMDYARKGLVCRDLPVQEGRAIEAFSHDGTEFSCEKMGEVMSRNAAGWPVSVQGQDGILRKLSYDALGHVTCIEAEDGTQEFFRHTVWGNVTEHRTGEGVEYFSYDCAGNVTGTMDREGRRNSYRYDENNELVQKQEQGPDIRGHAVCYAAERSPRSLYEACWQGTRRYPDLSGYSRH